MNPCSRTVNILLVCNLRTHHLSFLFLFRQTLMTPGQLAQNSLHAPPQMPYVPLFKPASTRAPTEARASFHAISSSTKLIQQAHIFERTTNLRKSQEVASIARTATPPGCSRPWRSQSSDATVRRCEAHSLTLSLG